MVAIHEQYSRLSAQNESISTETGSGIPDHSTNAPETISANIACATPSPLLVTFRGIKVSMTPSILLKSTILRSTNKRHPLIHRIRGGNCPRSINALTQHSTTAAIPDMTSGDEDAIM